MKSTSLKRIVECFDTAKVLCLGDIILDSFNHGHVDRISPERPVPVFRPGNEINVLGGAANVAQNVASLGGQCTIIGSIGNDHSGFKIQQLLQGYSNINASLAIS